MRPSVAADDRTDPASIGHRAVRGARVLDEQRSSFHTDLYCLDADGGGTTIGGVKLVAVQFGYASLVVFGFVLGIRTLRRLMPRTRNKVIA